MCGITGKLNFDPDQPVDSAVLARMTGILRHRGPDDEGIWTAGSIGFGAQRLAIIDLSQSGHQPMSNEDGSIWITYNGEIYNHERLRSRLEKLGHRYRGTSDTETILHLYEEYGCDCLHHLQGMFSFAIWDANCQRLFLARDRFGKKPLLYAQTGSGITFASEIKALLQDPAVSCDVDEVAIHHYMTYGYVPSPMTAFVGIRKLPPASMLICEAGRISIRKYWCLHYLPKLEINEEEAAEELRKRLNEAVRIRLMSEVPLGAFLSGGMDSSAIVALMAEAMNEPVKTFSIGFDDQTFDELPYARLVARQYSTDHHEFVVRSDAMAVLPELVWAYGEPFADSSSLPTYYLARETSRFVTVALNGDGGDEAFAGYERYLATRLADKYERLPGWIREKVIVPAVHRLPESTRRKDLIRRMKRFVAAIDASPERRYARWIILLDNLEKQRLYSADFASRMGQLDSITLLEQFYRQADSPDFIERSQFVDVQTYLPDDLLVKVDIASMAHSLECRSPFLDHELMEFVARLPVDYKLHGRTSKYLLRRSFRKSLPEAILKSDKRGFGMPVGQWFKQELSTVAYDVLLDPATLGRGILSAAGVQALLDEHVSGQANHGYQIWQLLCLELWFRTYIDRPCSELNGPMEGIL